MRSAVLEAFVAELVENGYGSLTHRNVAKRAGINPATVYRRWPSIAGMLADLLTSLGADLVPVPNTGALRSDFAMYLDRIFAVLKDPAMCRLIQAVLAAETECEEDVQKAVQAFWRTRFEGAYMMLDRAVLRGELNSGCNRQHVIEMLVAPAWFRTFISQMPISNELKIGSINAAVLIAGLSSKL